MVVCMLSMFVAVYSNAETLKLGKVSIDNIGINKRLIRLNDNGLMLDNSGMCLEVNVGIQASGMTGKRVICSVNPLDSDGDILADQLGEAMSLGAITIPRADYTGSIMIPLPYQWVVTDGNKQLRTVNLGVSLLCVGDESLGDSKNVTLSESDINIDRSKIGDKLIGDVLGTPDDMLGGFLGSLFDTSDVEATHDCPACDGTGICPYCDGDAFFDPSLCRKCNADPGICRRCKGEGTVTVKYDVY